MILTPFVTTGATEDLDADPNEETPGLAPPADDTTQTDEPVVDAATSDDDEVGDEPSDDGDDFSSVESLGMEIEHLINLAGAIEQFGISPAMMMIADRDGLLASTFVSIPATEAMAGHYRPTAQTSTVALEGVLDAIKSKTAEWAAKAGAAVKSLGEKASNLIKRAVEGVNHLSTTIAAKTWNAAKATGREIKAHPYKTAAAVIAAIAAAAVVIGVVWGLPTAPTAVAGWASKVQSALANIKSPFGSLSLATNGERFKSVWTPLSTADKAATGTAAKLGYSSKTVLTSGLAGLKGAMGKALAAVSRIGMTGLEKFGKQVLRVGAGISNKTGVSKETGETLGIWVVAVALGVTLALLRRIIMSGYRLIKSTFIRVADATSGGEEAAA